MAETIAYDKHVTDLIAALSATGHVTHTRYTKTSVTFHHNGGNLTHNGVLSVWKTRPASAHFDVNSAGDVAQYVQVQEYAWAVGNTGGNQSSISIEMANSTFAPHWEVSETTWKSAARLAGWLFAHVIKATPTANNVHFHHDWSSTECPGPYMDSIRAKVLAEVQHAYASFTEGSSSPSSPHPTTPAKKSVAEVAKDVIAGKYGNGSDRTAALRKAGYDPAAVQAEVNKELGHTAGTKKSVTTVAKEVIAGNWGNGDDRKARLTKAGYDYNAVQHEVNRLLG